MTEIRRTNDLGSMGNAFSSSEYRPTTPTFQSINTADVGEIVHEDSVSIKFDGDLTFSRIKLPEREGEEQ